MSIQGEDSLHLDFAEQAVLRTREGDTLRGRGEILSYVSTSAFAEGPRFEFFTRRVYRCDAERGIETGTYRITPGAGNPIVRTGGGWRALWRRSASGDWEIADALLLTPGESAPPISSTCIDTATEIAATSRLTVSLHGGPLGRFTAEPHGSLQTAGRYPYRSVETARPGVVLQSSYRVSTGLSLGGLWGLDPHVRTRYHGAPGDREWLDSSATLLAATLGYQGRNVSVSAGPALAHSWWEWTDPGPSGRLAEGAKHTRVGAVVTAQFFVPLRSDVGIEAIVQRRFLGAEAVPRTDPVRQASHSGLYLGLGLAVRRTEG